MKVQIGSQVYTCDVEVPREAGRVVLAHGEMTGHAHAISAPQAKLYQPSDTDALALGTRILETRKPVALTHEEHDRIDIPRGVWGVRIQRQYEAGAFRRVED